MSKSKTEAAGSTKTRRTASMIITRTNFGEEPPQQVLPYISLSIGGSGYGKIRYDFHGKIPNRWWRFWQYIFLGFVWRTTSDGQPRA